MLKSLTAVLAAALLTVVASSVTAADDHPRGGRGGRPSFDTLLDAFDGDDSGDLTESEVPFPVWRRLSHAGADGDGLVTHEEFESVQEPGRR